MYEMRVFERGAGEIRFIERPGVSGVRRKKGRKAVFQLRSSRQGTTRRSVEVPGLPQRRRLPQF
jgi:hypothetical protein